MVAGFGAINPRMDARNQLMQQISPFLDELAGLAVSARYRFTTLKKSEVPETAGLYVLYKEEPLEVFYVGKASLQRTVTVCVFELWKII